MRTIPGVVTGIVMDVDDPNKVGRVRVKFPWLNAEYRSNWIPIAAPMSGKRRGHFFMPEIEDEVLVAFEQGNFDHPFVVGFLWNGVDTPPETELKNRVILTPGGHTLRFEDKDGAKKVVLKSNAGHRVELDDQRERITVSDSGGVNQIVIEMQPGQIKIQATSNVTVQAPQINLVESSTHPLVFGDQLLAYLNQLVALFNAHLHVGQLTLGVFPVVPTPPATPFPPATPALLSTKVKTG